MTMRKQAQFTVWYWIAAIVLMLWLNQMFQQYRQVEPLAYGEFIGLLNDGKVKKITVLDNHIQGELLAPRPDGRTTFIAMPPVSD